MKKLAIVFKEAGFAKGPLHFPHPFWTQSKHKLSACQSCEKNIRTRRVLLVAVTQNVESSCHQKVDLVGAHILSIFEKSDDVGMVEITQHLPNDFLSLLMSPLAKKSFEPGKCEKSPQTAIGKWKSIKTSSKPSELQVSRAPFSKFSSINTNWPCFLLFTVGRCY